MSDLLSLIFKIFKLIRDFFVDIFFDSENEIDLWLAFKKIINKFVKIIVYSILLIPRTFKLMRDFFVDVLFGGINEMVFSLAFKKNISRFVRVIVYSLTLIPLSAFFVFCIISKFNVESSFDTVMLYIFTTGTFISYLYALKVILSSKQEQIKG